MPQTMAVAIILASLMLSSFVSGQAVHKEGLRLDVPYVAQVKEGCGSAAIAMVLRWWKAQGHEVPEDVGEMEAIHRAVYSASASGTAAKEVERYFRQLGFRTFAFPGSWPDLAEHLAKGRPLIAAIRPSGQRQLHYVVISGVSKTRVLLHDSADKPYRVLGRAEFEKQWSASKRWTLLALPPS